MTEKRPADPNIIHNIAAGYMGTCVLLAALELDVFDEIVGKSLSTQGVAEALDLHPVPTERLLVGLTSLSLLERANGKYSCSPETERYLVKSSPSYSGDYYRFQKNSSEENRKPPIFRVASEL